MVASCFVFFLFQTTRVFSIVVKFHKSEWHLKAAQRGTTTNELNYDLFHFNKNRHDRAKKKQQQKKIPLFDERTN